MSEIRYGRTLQFCRFQSTASGMVKVYCLRGERCEPDLPGLDKLNPVLRMNGPRVVRLAEEKKNTVWRMFRGQVPVREIAKQLDVSSETVWGVIREAA